MIKFIDVFVFMLQTILIQCVSRKDFCDRQIAGKKCMKINISTIFIFVDLKIVFVVPFII